VESEIGEVWGRFSDQIWADIPGVVSFSHCINGADEELKWFAESGDESWQFIDLRQPVLGEGFSRGRNGPKTAIQRL
jgi:hypothetical protein